MKAVLRWYRSTCPCSGRSGHTHISSPGWKSGWIDSYQWENSSFAVTSVEGKEPRRCPKVRTEPDVQVLDSSSLNELEPSVATLHQTDSLLLMRNFNTHVAKDTRTWGSVIGKHDDAHLNHNKKLLLDFCGKNALTVMTTIFQHKDIHKYTWYWDVLGQRSVIDFMMASPDLKMQVLDVRVMRGQSCQPTTFWS